MMIALDRGLILYSGGIHFEGAIIFVTDYVNSRFLRIYSVTLSEYWNSIELGHLIVLGLQVSTVLAPCTWIR